MMMNALVVVLAVAGQWEYGVAARSPAQTVAAIPAPPQIEVKFNENAATKDDVRALADALTDLRKQVVALKPAARPAAATAPAAAPPARKRWELADDRGKRWWSYDPDALIAHVARENTAIVRSLSWTGTACSSSPLGSFGSPLLGTPLSFGGFSGGCAGGSCR